ncbi:MAG: helix-turn-helix transcriptional regulator [Clostridia bacterium]|nr:helix-turn-helix transcriptional regulator [Clostridia bacterium]MBQ8893187.1 helix-turn-helix transcriptional regulator [Clostridia bacterium]
MNSQNICKFIVPREKEQLTAANFIYEQQGTHSGETRTLSDHVMYLATGGEGFFRCSGEVQKLTAGKLFFSLADVPFCIESTKALKYYYITFNGGRAEELFRRFGITPGRSVFEGYEGLIPFWQESLARADEENIDLLSESVLLYTFSKLKRAAKSNDKVGMVLGYLEEHFTEPGLTLSSVAEAAGYNAKYLSHLFKKEFGMGFAEYLRILRIKHAVILMENGVTSVKNVAILSGFSDPLYFSRVFTKTVGVSPKNYKK